MEDADKKASMSLESESEGLQAILIEILKLLPSDFLVNYEKRQLYEMSLSDAASRTKETISITENTEEKTMSSEDFGDVSPSNTSRSRGEEGGIKNPDVSKATVMAGYKLFGQSMESKPKQTFELISRNGAMNNKKEKNEKNSNSSDEEDTIDESSGKMIDETSEKLKEISRQQKTAIVSQNTNSRPHQPQINSSETSFSSFSSHPIGNNNNTNNINNNKPFSNEKGGTIYDINKSNSLTRILDEERSRCPNPSLSFNMNLMQYLMMMQNQQQNVFANALSHLFNPYSISQETGSGL